MTRLLPLIFFIRLAAHSKNSYGQSYTSALPVQMNGYVLNVGGFILFQPCEDTTKSVWEAMNNTSFPLWYFHEDLYLEAISGLGDSVRVAEYDTKENKTYNINFSYFYCSLDVNMFVLDTANFKVFKEPRYQISYNGRTHPAYGFYVDNRIVKLVPKRDSDLLGMYRYYFDKGYTVPKWLQDTVNTRTLKPKN